MEGLSIKFPYMKFKGTLTIDGKSKNVWLRETKTEVEEEEMPLFSQRNDIIGFKRNFKETQVFIVEEIEL